MFGPRCCWQRPSAGRPDDTLMHVRGWQSDDEEPLLPSIVPPPSSAAAISPGRAGNKGGGCTAVSEVVSVTAKLRAVNLLQGKIEQLRATVASQMSPWTHCDRWRSDFSSVFYCFLTRLRKIMNLTFGVICRKSPPPGVGFMVSGHRTCAVAPLPVMSPNFQNAWEHISQSEGAMMSRWE